MSESFAFLQERNLSVDWLPSAESFEVVSDIAQPSDFEIEVAVVLDKANRSQVEMIRAAVESWAAVMNRLREIKLRSSIASERPRPSLETWLRFTLGIRESDQQKRNLNLLCNMLDTYNDMVYDSGTEHPVRRLHFWETTLLREEPVDPKYAEMATDYPPVRHAETFELTALVSALTYWHVRMLFTGFDPERLEELRRLILAWDVATDAHPTLTLSYVGYPGCSETRAYSVHVGGDATYFGGLVAHIDKLNAEWIEAGGIVLNDMEIFPTGVST